MLNQQSTIFPKQIKIDDYEESTNSNILRIMESSNLLLGTGARASHTAIIMAKCLHFLQDEGTMCFAGKQLLQLGCGVGLIGIYLSCLGANMILTDLPAMKDMAQRNININKDKIKGQVEFGVLNWKKEEKEQMMEKQQQGVSTSSSDKSYLKEGDKIDLTIVCECGNIQDLKMQLKWMGKQGIMIGFMQRSFDFDQQYMNASVLEKFLLENELEYERIETYHPDYEDERVCIYRVWK